MIYIIDDDEIMAECLARNCKKENTRIFSNVYEAINAIDDDFPDLIFLDILLDGADGFTLINELASYSDTAKIPIVIVSSLDLRDKDLSNYGIVGVLNKSNMTPKEVRDYVIKYTE